MLGKIKSISVSKGITVNLGHFENIKFEASIEMEVDGDEYSDSYDLAWNIVDNEINNQVQEINSVIPPESCFKVESKKPSRKRS